MATAYFMVGTVLTLLVGPGLGFDGDLRVQDQELEETPKYFVDVENEDDLQVDVHGRMQGCFNKPRCSALGGVCQKVGTCPGATAGRRCTQRCDCCLPTPSCIFGDKAYPNGDWIDGTCLELQCINGEWKYNGDGPRADCGECSLVGDPHVKVYDTVNWNYTDHQFGEFAITQPGFNNSELFGINANFQNCTPPASFNSCITAVTYYEPLVNVTLVPPPSAYWCSLSDANAKTPNCSITVLVNKKERSINDSVLSFHGTDGTVLVFKHPHIYVISDVELYCISVVGSKGLSMVLCQHYENWPFFYVYAMPSLKSDPSLLYGLCDVYTGFGPLEGYTMRNDTDTYNVTEFVSSWKVHHQH